MLLETLCGSIYKVYRFDRILLGSRVFHSKSYKKPTKRNSFTVAYIDRSGSLSFGYVKYYTKCMLKCKNKAFCDRKCYCKVPQYAAVMERALPLDRAIEQNLQVPSLPHIKPFKKDTTELDCCTIDNIMKMCVSIKMPKVDIDFICRFPNLIESD